MFYLFQVSGWHMTMEYFSGIKTAPLSYKTQGLEDWFIFFLEVLDNEQPDWHSWAKTSVSQPWLHTQFD